MSESDGWGWWTVWESLDIFEEDLEKICPNPATNRLINHETEYSLPELRTLLQVFGSYLSSLNAIHGKISAQCHALKEGIDTGLNIAMIDTESRQTSVTAKKAEILASNDVFKDGIKKQINHESCQTFIAGWIKAYTSAWDTVSRMITVEMGEAEHLTGRHS